MFDHESVIQDAVLRRLEIVADATDKLSDALKARHPEIPWHQVHGFRNIAAHAYEELDLRRAWEIIEKYLPALKAVINSEIGPFGPFVNIVSERFLTRTKRQYISSFG